ASASIRQAAQVLAGGPPCLPGSHLAPVRRASSRPSPHRRLPSLASSRSHFNLAKDARVEQLLSSPPHTLTTHGRPPVSLTEFYNAQLKILWNWKGGPWALVRRFIVTTIVAAVAFLITDWILPGMTVDGVGPVIVAVVLVTLFNAIFRTVIISV